jgi:large subunit ribosomal protein L9
VKVVLREDIDTLGRKGDLLDVADGYARNFLVPRGLAFQATRGAVKQAEAMRRNRDVRDTRERDAAQTVATALSGVRVEVKARAGEGG